MGRTENPSYRALLSDYLQALKPFTDAQLEAGMRAFVSSWTMARWPKIGELTPFMREAPVARLQGRKLWKEGYWPAVDARCQRYMEGFMAGTLGRQAAAEGWSDRLHGFVRKRAWYQAQIAERCERKGKAFDCRANGKDGRRFWSDKDIEFWQLEELQRHGDITVSIPTDDLERMKVAA